MAAGLNQLAPYNELLEKQKPIMEQQNHNNNNHNDEEDPLDITNKGDGDPSYSYDEAFWNSIDIPSSDQINSQVNSSNNHPLLSNNKPNAPSNGNTNQLMSTRDNFPELIFLFGPPCSVS